ncbi:hypothetical protein IQ231_08550 [Cuspidothrix issatschenkoi LEGE 03284]|uniref:hypothetical protein n=1 Tax=Cuspidothrix issatschenkoi TaxID=230752 RepID=UPI00187E32F6|nr:hypothetical protein [Cuspidothrix issatschenkoi]MBE9231737.1 hypothetical protein [Cuspidothrix issatschenkoi LEGE 03284]
MNDKPRSTLKPGTVYIQDCISKRFSKLYTLDLTTGKANFVAEIVREVTDIAFVESELYGLAQNVNKTQLLKININSGDATVIGDIGFSVSGLAYHYQRQTLYATTAKELISINLETGRGTSVFTVAGKDYNCGEVAFDHHGKAYITLIGYNKKKLLAECNLETGVVKQIGDTGFPNIGSLEFVGEILYGVTGNFFNLGKDGQLVRIDPRTGKGTLVTKTDPTGRWAGISVYQPVAKVAEKITPKTPPTIVQEIEKTATAEDVSVTTSEDVSVTTSEEIKITKEENMSTLTIDTKNNCYVINAEQINNLQTQVASKFAFDKGNFEIRISGGSYSYSQDKTGGEPYVLLWIYGENGSTFINQNTGYQGVASWTTLNGYHDVLKLEVKDKAVLCALFFDTNKDHNSGSVDILITSNKAFFNPQTLTVDSKLNCYLLDAGYLSGLQQSGVNSVDLKPGNYRIKIREGNASYWSKDKKIDIEPWALFQVHGGKFITKLTGIEVGETWFSLNGIKDEVILEVKEETTLSGLFFDTYNEDNEGQIILDIESVTAEYIAESYLKTSLSTTINITEITGSSSGGETIVSSSSSSSSSTTVGSRSAINFSFNFNESEFKQKWEDQLQQINASIKGINETDVTLEAKYWDQLETWLLKNYEKHFKTLAVDVAKLRFTVDAYLQQMEFSLNQHLQTWSGYLETLIEDKISVEISNKVNQQISRYIDQSFEQKIISNIDVIINNIVHKTELNQYIDQRLNQVFDQKIQNSINVITQNLINNNTQLNQYVSQQIDNTYQQKIENNLQVITQNLVNNNQILNQYFDQRLLQTVVNNTEINNTIVNSVANSTTINDKFENVRNEWNGSFINLFNQHIDELVKVIGGKDTFITLLTQNLTNNNTELNQYVNQQIDNTYQQKIENNRQMITQSIVNNNQELNDYVNQQVQQTVINSTEIKAELVNLVANSTTINDKLENVRNEWNGSFINLFNQHIDELVKVIGGKDTFITLLTQNLTNNNTELNQYVNQQIDNTYQQKIENNRQMITQSIVNNNQELNDYVNQQVQQTVINSTEIKAELMNLVANNTTINDKLENVRHEWNSSFINLFNQHIDELVKVIGGKDTFITLLTQNLTNNNTGLNQYVNQQIDNTYQQKIENNLQVITQNIVNNNQQLNQYIDHRLHQTIMNNTTINNDVVNLVANSTAINAKIQNVSQEVDIKIDNIRNEWNRTFITLVSQQVDQIINIIVSRDTFNVVMANTINAKVDELLNQIIKVKNELIVIMNNADRHLYEWTLGELMAIKGCLTDREALVDLLVTFSAEMRTKLDSAPCVDINTFKPFTPISIDTKKPQQLPGR